jgi:diguanylate cyclase (GGDEF)-like protein
MHDGRSSGDARGPRGDEGVEWALSELEKAITGSADEAKAREALDLVRRAFCSVRTSASTDPLTGLSNRAWFYQVLEERLSKGRSISPLAAVLFLDLDGFKEVNDQRGHQAGDALLAEVAARISLTVRELDLVARHGGDEFVVLLERIESPAVAHAVAARIIDAIGVPFTVDDEEFRLGVSIGVALYPERQHRGRAAQARRSRHVPRQVPGRPRVRRVRRARRAGGAPQPAPQLGVGAVSHRNGRRAGARGRDPAARSQALA